MKSELRWEKTYLNLHMDKTSGVQKMTVYDILLNFFIYSFLGWCTEVAFAAVKQKKFVNRGFLNGPLCPIYGIGVTVVVAVLEPYMDHLLMLYLMSAFLVTALEYVTGALLEKIFHHKWWDYSEVPFNIKGYVCIPFSLIWGAACVMIVKFIHPALYRAVSFMPEYLGMVLLTFLCGLILADVYVTVTGILKLNRRLDKMEQIANELRHVSEQIGESIYQNMMDGMEKQEQIRAKAEELKQRYEEMLENLRGTERRILSAFPKMKSKKYGRHIEELREYLKRKRRS